MTEHTFGGLAVAAPPTAPVMDPVDESGDDNRRKLAIVGAVVAVVVVLIAAFFLMKGSGGNSTAPAVPNALAGATQTPATGAATAPATTKPVHLPKSFAGSIGRDPFKALYVQPVVKTGSGSSPTTTTTPTDSTTPTGTTTTPTGTTNGTGTTGTTGTTTPTTPVFRPVWIKLVKVTSSGAKFDVGFSDHKNLKVRHFSLGVPSASKPEVFARNFAFLRMSGGSVMLQYGDGTPFILDAQHPLMIVN